MSQPANDEFSQHLSDDEASNHEDASDTGAAPKQQQQVIPQTTAISNIKLPILKKEEYDIWAMEMEHYLEYIDNDVWKVIQNGNSKKRISTGKDGVIRILPPVTAAEIQVVEKERKAKNILLMAIPKEHMRRFHGMDDAKEIWEAIRTRFGGAGKKEQKQNCLLIMDDGVVNWGEHTVEEEESNHALMAISSSSEGPQESEPNVSNDRSSEYSTCQSNNSAGSIRISFVHSVDSESEISSVPPEVYVSTPITTNEKGVSDPKSKEVGTQEPEPSVTMIDPENVLTSQSNDSAGSIGTSSVHSVDFESEISKVPQEVTNINSVRSRVNTVTTNVNTVRSRPLVPTRISNSFSPKRLQGNWGSAVKTSTGYNWRNSKPNSNCDNGPTFIRTVNAKGSSTKEHGFAEIVDFLRGSNLRYALTTNPTIYDSLVKQFWQTATANTLADGTLELQATIDTIVYTITEASIRNKLQGLQCCQTMRFLRRWGIWGILLTDLLPFRKAFSHPNRDF
ncbi:hypothetical protein Tco_0194857 [Tanacetum coccineum]